MGDSATAAASATALSSAAVRPGVDTAGVIASPQLSEREQSILAFERHWWRFSGAKEQSIRAEFDITPAVYHQLLNALLDDPRALEFDPILIRRLLRLRAARHSARTARREGR